MIQECNVESVELKNAKLKVHTKKKNDSEKYKLNQIYITAPVWIKTREMSAGFRNLLSQL